MSNVTGGTITVRVSGQDVGLSDLLARLNTQMNSGLGAIRNYNTTLESLNPTTKAVQAEQVRFAQAMAAVAAKSGDTAGAIGILGTALTQVNTQTVAAQQGLGQMQNLLNNQAAAAEKASFSFKGVAQGLTTLIGGYVVASRVVREFGEVIGTGNELEKTLTTFRVLSGSAAEYEKNLALAKNQQALFGGSLNDTVEGMSEFANLSHRTGIEVTKLTNLSRALATVDPAQGFKGASIALKEFFSGDNTTSLSRRFEIPKDVLNNIIKITDKKEQFDALSAALANFGISQELVSAQASTTAVAYDKLSGSITDAKAAIGQFLAVALTPAANTLAKWANDAAVGFDTLTHKSESLNAIAGKIFNVTGSFDAFNARIRDTNATMSAAIGPLAAFTAHIQELTPAQYALVTALINSGNSAAEAFEKLQANADALDHIRSNVASASAWYNIAADTAREFETALGETAVTSQEAAGFAVGLAQAVAKGLPVEQAYIALQQFKANAVKVAAAAQQEQTTATQAALTATDLFAQSTVQETAAKIESQAAGDALKITHDQLYAAALAAAQGMGATQQSAAILAGQFGITTASAYSLIGALAQLEVAKAKQQLGVQPGGANEREDRLGSNADIIARAKAAKLAADVAKAERENALAAADAAGKVNLEKDALARLDKGSVEYVKQLGKVQAAERALAAEQERKRKKNEGAPKLTPNEKINTALLDQQDKFDNKMEDAEQKHWDKMADIYTKFNEEQQKQFAKNEVSKRRSRADFYAGLQDAPAGVDTQKFAAQYEEAFAKAQEIAQTGKAKLANDFLELRQKQIEEMKKLDEEAAKIAADRKDGKLSKKDADAQLEYLKGRKKLVEDAQKEEQDQLINAGDENQKHLQEQLDQENQAYADQSDKIATAAERAADAKIKHAERSKIKVSEENKELATQNDLYDKIAAKNGGVVPKVPTNAPASNGSVDPSQKPTVDVTATQPLPVSTAQALLVHQDATFLVTDVDAINAIADMATRLEAGLGTIAQAVNDAKTAITGAVGAVESAVGRIKLTSQSVVGN